MGKKKKKCAEGWMDDGGIKAVGLGMSVAGGKEKGYGIKRKMLRKVGAFQVNDEVDGLRFKSFSCFSKSIGNASRWDSISNRKKEIKK